MGLPAGACSGQGFQLGVAAGVEQGIEIGIEKVRQERERIGQVLFLEYLLGTPQCNRDELLLIEIENHLAMVADLQRQLRNRNG